MDELPIRPAATVILVRDAVAGLETLLLRRASSLKFHGGAWVFPGGRIDPADYEGATVPDDPADPRHEPAARRAATREALEEAGLVIGPETLIPFAHWITPVERPRRFSTWFYLAEVADAPVSTDGGEITDHRWVSPTAALELRAAGDIELPRPTAVSLERLSACASCAEALREAHEGECVEFRPQT